MTGLPKTQDDACVSVRPEAGALQTNLICTDTKLICPKETLIIGRYSARLICQSIAKRGGRPRDDGTAAVSDRPLKRSANFRKLSAYTSGAKD
jgi:hypothetical protein